MARDAKGRFLPVTSEEDWGDGRHAFSQEERRKGYRQAAKTKRLPSRLRSWLWGKIKRYYGAYRS